MKCWKCNKHYGNETRLVGGYSLHLCPRCTNKWSQYVRLIPEFDALEDIETEIKNPACNVARAIGLTKEARRLLRELFRLGEEWAPTPEKDDE